MAGLCPGHDVFPLIQGTPNVHCRLPPRPDRCPRDARDRGREACDRCRRDPLQGPHRRAAGGDGQGHHRRRRLHPIEMPVGAGGMVPGQARPRGCPRAGGEFRQRQCLHRQDRTAVDRADRLDCRQGGRMQRQ